MAGSINYPNYNSQPMQLSLLAYFLQNETSEFQWKAKCLHQGMCKQEYHKVLSCPPTLFNLYINDTPKTIGVNLALFVDYTCLYATKCKEGYVLRKLKHGLSSVVAWCKR
jgi:hypothetical protein